jgi:hypothetical protein
MGKPAQQVSPENGESREAISIKCAEIRGFATV